MPLSRLFRNGSRPKKTWQTRSTASRIPKFGTKFGWSSMLFRSIPASSYRRALKGDGGQTGGYDPAVHQAAVPVIANHHKSATTSGADGRPPGDRLAVGPG